MRFLKFPRFFLSTLLYFSIERLICYGEIDFNNTQVGLEIYNSALPLNNLQNRNNIWFYPNAEIAFSGHVKKLYSNNQVEVLMKLSDGLVVQLSRWKENGIPIYSVETIPGSISPLSIPSVMEKLDGSKFNGEARFWYPTGQNMLQTQYSLGKKNGITRSWYENGNLKVEESYKNGVKDGNARSWFENGKKWMDYTHWNDRRDGPLVWWYENGRKRQEGNYKGGQRFGEWTYYKEDGSILYRKTFRDGKSISTQYGEESDKEKSKDQF